jgi:hypothetical protein
MTTSQTPEKNMFRLKKIVNIPAHSIDMECTTRCPAEDIHRMTSEISQAYPLLNIVGSDEHRDSLGMGSPILVPQYEYDDATIKVEGVPLQYGLTTEGFLVMIQTIKDGLMPLRLRVDARADSYWLPEGLLDSDKVKIANWFDYVMVRMSQGRLIEPPRGLHYFRLSDPIALAVLPMHDIWILDYSCRTKTINDNDHWASLGNPMLPPDLLTYFCSHPVPLLRRSASKNPSCPEEGRAIAALMDSPLAFPARQECPRRLGIDRDRLT